MKSAHTLTVRSLLLLLLVAALSLLSAGRSTPASIAGHG